MINHFKSGLLLLAGLFVVACGGGGGGGASRVSGTFTVEDASVVFEADIMDPRPDPKSVIGTVTGAEGTLYVYAHLTSTAVIEQAVIKINGDTGELVLTPVLPSSLGNGFHHDTVTVSVCGDVNCKFHLSGSPKNISVTYTVSPTDRITVKANISTGGGVTHDSGLFQCAESCEKVIFGVDGELVRLWPQEQPGFIFTGWSGCDADAGTSGCTFTFQESSTVEVTANFVPSGTFNLCPGVAEATFSGKGTVSLAKVNDLLPLCNGYAILAMDDRQIIVRNVTNGSEPALASYELSSTAYKLALDEENRFLYATHSSGRKISRINLATGTVSELYYRGGEGFEQSEWSYSPAIAVTDKGTLIAPDYGFPLSHSAYLYDSGTGMYLKASGLVQSGGYKYIDSVGGLLTSYQANWHFYLFNENTQSFTHRSEGSGNGGSACRDVIMSPDSMHVVNLCIGGYQKEDWSGVNNSLNDNIKLGEWDAGFLIQSGSFSPSGESVVFAGGNKVKLFDVDTYASVWSVEVEQVEQCNLEKVFISSDGKLVYSLNQCGFGGSSALAWISIETPN